MKIALVLLFAFVASSQAQLFTFGGFNPFGFISSFFPNPFTIQPVVDPEEPSEDQSLLCTSLSSFKAKSFNAIRFTLTTSYRDGMGLRTIFEEAGGDFSLYDFPAGKVSVFIGGQCAYYENENFKMTLADALANIQINFEIDDFAGTSGQGYSVTNGDVTYRGIINEKCADVYNYIAIDNVPETIVFTTEFDYDFDVAAKFAEVDAIFAAHNANGTCIKFELD